MNETRAAIGFYSGCFAPSCFARRWTDGQDSPRTSSSGLIGPGGFRPDPGVFSDFDGLSVNGCWQLQIVDNDLGDIGTLLDWKLIAEV